MLDLAAEGSIVAGNVFRHALPLFLYPINACTSFVGAIAHPAFLEESHFEKITRTLSSHPPSFSHRLRAYINTLTGPLLLSCAGECRRTDTFIFSVELTPSPRL